MKRVFITAIAAIFLLAGVAIAETTYKLESEDGTVEERNDVWVKETDTETVVKTQILTLRKLDLEIAALDARIQRLKDKKIALQAVRALVQAEADKVVLKP